MTGLISNNELTRQLGLIIPNCKHITIISAFMTQPATRWLRQLTEKNKPNVELVGRFTPKDFAEGASDFAALRDCINSGFQVKALANLHAKIYQIDFETIFNGSANLTGKGLALVSKGNLESCSRVAPTCESKSFIKKIVDSSTLLTLSILDKMEEYLEQLKSEDKDNLPAVWPEAILIPSTDLFVSDFPLGKPGNDVNEYKLNPSLPFAQIEANRDDFLNAAYLFKSSKIYRWLKKQITENQTGRNLGFGQISSLLHDKLADDPAPYRQEIKSIQANLYLYIKLYASDDVEVYVPGGRSEVLRVK
ncbi:hypothetical protein E0Z06_13755 [Rheinheimera sp. D18]|uniref:phospholipase D-like domain-containing protein n=1 Tax=Rheinheimera sp. D18 TaxID=2545632 RepID=UPI001044D92B|nr:phospholipase D-like domain-containing protein [Rheinheimera sp. D18]QBL10514.1 hypothetical protein E0Z06_13755 [Rheinheimera sp. D18]